MLRTNLSTRPFYNERAVTALLLIAAVVVVVASAFNVLELVSLSRRHAQLGHEVAQAQQRAADERQQAARVRGAIDPRQLAAVESAAHEANQLIDRRTFSWTELFNRFEATLPPEVRITSVKPSLDADGRFLVLMTVAARHVGDIDGFMEALEKTGAFRGMLVREERTTDEGLIEATLEGTYLPGTNTSRSREGRP
jgi:Tfp pilus assembly protein PilN